jgi:hypothetical protein
MLRRDRKRKVYKGSVSAWNPPKKSYSQKMLDILELCLPEERKRITKTDIARCCGSLSGSLSGSNKDLLTRLLDEGLLTHEKVTFRSARRGFDMTAHVYETTEAGAELVKKDDEDDW